MDAKAKKAAQELELRDPLLRKKSPARPSDMSEIFDSYEEEFKQTSGEARKKISDVLTYESNPGKKRDLIRGAETQVASLDGLIKAMKVEVRSQNPATQATLNVKVQTYEKALATLKQDLSRAKEKEDRDQLLGGGGAGLSLEHRQRMLTTQSRIEDQNRTIENARRVVAETEQVGIEIGAQLDEQRHKIQSIREKVLEVSGLTNTARRLISSISRRETQQKLMLWGVAIVLFICIVLIIYYGSQKKK